MPPEAQSVFAPPATADKRGKSDKITPPIAPLAAGVGEAGIGKIVVFDDFHRLAGAAT